MPLGLNQVLFTGRMCARVPVHITYTRLIQIVVEPSESAVPGSNDVANRPPRTFAVRVSTPGTTGDDFGVFVRSRGARINPSTDPAPAKSWFEFANPFSSNPYSKDDQNFGSRPPCLTGQCNGIYGNSLPAIQGAQYDVKVPLGWCVSVGSFGCVRICCDSRGWLCAAPPVLLNGKVVCKPVTIHASRFHSLLCIVSHSCFSL